MQTKNWNLTPKPRSRHTLNPMKNRVEGKRSSVWMHAGKECPERIAHSIRQDVQCKRQRFGTDNQGRTPDPHANLPIPLLNGAQERTQSSLAIQNTTASRSDGTPRRGLQVTGGAKGAQGQIVEIFCVEYCWLNRVTQHNTYPIPQIDDNLDVLAGSCYFSTLDITSGNWQVPLDRHARIKSAFCTQSGLWQ